MTSNTASPAGTIPNAPGALPFIGHSAALARHPLRFLSSMANAGDLLQVRLGPFRTIAVCNPDIARQVFRNDRVFDKGGPMFDLIKEVTGHRAMVVMEHAEHRPRRRMVQPAFHHARFPAYAEVILDQVDAVMGSWREGESIDLYEQSKLITSRVGLLTMFSYMQPDWLLKRALRDSITIMEGVFRRIITPSALNRIPTLGNLRYNRANARLRAVVDEIIDEYRRHDVDRGDMLSVLLKAESEQQAGVQGRTAVSNTDVHDEVTVFFLAAMDTTAASLAWTLTEMMRRPEVYQRLRSELAAELGGERVSLADLPRLKYMAQVAAESLRLHPPVWLLTRNVTADTELAGHTVKAGSAILLSPYVLHQREDMFPDAGRFDPDRWAEPGMTSRIRDALMPFGSGPRKCIGEVFGMTELLLALARIVPTWELGSRGSEPRSSVSFVLSPRNSRATLRRIA
ncbi:cytochrome P450 [Streptomyces sp. PTM05]|uniref:Cytochrome P450 n=1 Tax=Streptantibioticus parmotrematis TaxID=2873249 RepID=A0ABS7QUZ6_9ACTN|nr:cytochrome P450 [Streptantibioticus parmotrematis]MBY8887015.1 cytochrome P450 [Streptantibioticus parmotrematis]